jgi:hypothetical protein
LFFIWWGLEIRSRFEGAESISAAPVEETFDVLNKNVLLMLAADLKLDST